MKASHPRLIWKVLHFHLTPINFFELRWSGKLFLDRLTYEFCYNHNVYKKNIIMWRDTWTNYFFFFFTNSLFCNKSFSYSSLGENPFIGAIPLNSLFYLSNVWRCYMIWVFFLLLVIQMSILSKNTLSSRPLNLAQKWHLHWTNMHERDTVTVCFKKNKRRLFHTTLSRAHWLIN